MLAQPTAERVTMMEPLTPEDEALAEAMVDEATAGFDRLLPPAAFARLREFLLNELLCSHDGRRRLRAARRDPEVDASGEVSRLPAVNTKPSKLG
jgi:hypothetical protein